MSGTDVLLLVNTGTPAAPTYIVVGSQRSLSRVENTAEIDVSSKDSRAMRVLPGRYDTTLSLEALYVPDNSCYLALQAANRNGEFILVRIQEAGIDIEEADAIVTSMTEDWPDQDAATIAVDLRIDGEWAAVGS